MYKKQVIVIVIVLCYNVQKDNEKNDKSRFVMSEHHHTHEHNYENCCSNHTPDNHGCGECGHEHFNEHKAETILKIVFSAALFIAGYIIEDFTGLPDYVFLLCYCVSYILVGFAIIRNALEGLLKGRIFDENSLMTIASIGAFILGEYTEGVAVMLLFNIGEFVQGLSVARSRKSINAILDKKHQGYELPRHYDNEESVTEQLITKFARIYTPVICVLSLLIFVIPPLLFKQSWGEWLHRGLAALVVGCPCAIVISVPICYSAGIGACSKNGLFVKNTSIMDKIPNCDTVVSYEENKSVDDIMVLQNNSHNIIYIGKHDTDVTALETANVSIAVGEDATALAVEAADIVASDEASLDLSVIKRIGKRTHKIALENIAFSIGIKVIILVLDVLLAKEIPMWFAIFGDIGVCLLAIANSARALRK